MLLFTAGLPGSIFVFAAGLAVNSNFSLCPGCVIMEEKEGNMISILLVEDEIIRLGAEGEEDGKISVYEGYVITGVRKESVTVYIPDFWQ